MLEPPTMLPQPALLPAIRDCSMRHVLLHLGGVQVKTQGCNLGAKDRVLDRLAWRMKSKEHVSEVVATTTAPRSAQYTPPKHPFPSLTLS